jgi:exodeoxyribonuclease V alpha subunit
VREARVVLLEMPAGRGVYKRPAWVAETGVAQALARLITAGGASPPLHLNDLLSQVQQGRQLELSAEQTAAVAAALREKVLIITGGPGTGKTTMSVASWTFTRAWGPGSCSWPPPAGPPSA